MEAVASMSVIFRWCDISNNFCTIVDGFNNSSGVSGWCCSHCGSWRRHGVIGWKREEGMWSSVSIRMNAEKCMMFCACKKNDTFFHGFRNLSVWVPFLIRPDSCVIFKFRFFESNKYKTGVDMCVKKQNNKMMLSRERVFEAGKRKERKCEQLWTKKVVEWWARETTASI